MKKSQLTISSIIIFSCIAVFNFLHQYIGAVHAQKPNQVALPDISGSWDVVSPAFEFQANLNWKCKVNSEKSASTVNIKQDNNGDIKSFEGTLRDGSKWKGILKKGNVLGKTFNLTRNPRPETGDLKITYEGKIYYNGNVIEGIAKCSPGEASGKFRLSRSPFTIPRDPNSSPKEGDIVIYWIGDPSDLSKISIIHSGVVREVNKSVVTKIESKMDAGARWLHDPKDYEHNPPAQWTVFRANRDNGSNNRLITPEIAASYNIVKFYTDANRPVTSYPFEGTASTQDVYFERRLRDLHGAKQTAPVSRDYNCHGYTFTDGKVVVNGGYTKEWVGNPVMIILEDNHFYPINALDTSGVSH